MTTPVKKFILVCAAVAFGTIFILDRIRVHEAEQVKTDEQIRKFAQKHLPPGESWRFVRNHGANTEIIRLALLPFIAREYRWTKEYRETEITFESEIVLYGPWDKYT